MASSAYQTSENVKFDGTLTPAVVLKNSGGIKSVVICDRYSSVDIALLDALIAAYGGTTPLSSGVAGQQTLNFKGTVVGGSATGLQNVSTATAGFATINVGGNKTGSSAPGFAAVGAAGYQGVNVGGGKSGATATGLANTTATYTASIVVDGVTKAVSIVGSAAQTYTTLLAELNIDLGATAVASIVSGNLRITSASTGTTSTVAITDTNLFSSLTGFVAVTAAVAGTGNPRKFVASVVVDGVTKTISLTASQATTYTTMLAEINNDLGSAATASLSSGNIVITSATTGTASSVVVYDTGFLFTSLPGYVGITSTAGTAPRVYTATITVDGVAKAISVQGSNAQTYTTLVSAINTGLSSAATAAISGGNIVVTSATTGVASTVVTTDKDLFASVTGFAGALAPQTGAADMLAVMQRERAPSGAKYSDIFNIASVAAKPAVPLNVKKTLAYTYFDGTVWKYLSDDTTVNT